MRSLYFAVRLLRSGVVVSLAVGAAGQATARSGVGSGELASEQASGDGSVCERMTIGSFSCTLKRKRQTVKRLTLIGTIGRYTDSIRIALVMAKEKYGFGSEGARGSAAVSNIVRTLELRGSKPGAKTVR